MNRAEEALGKLQDSRVLVLGTRLVGMLVMKALKARGVSSITVASRTLQITRSFCRTFGGTAVALEAVTSQLSKTDMVIVATRSSEYVLNNVSISGRNG